MGQHEFCTRVAAGDCIRTILCDGRLGGQAAVDEVAGELILVSRRLDLGGVVGLQRSSFSDGHGLHERSSVYELSGVAVSRRNAHWTGQIPMDTPGVNVFKFSWRTWWEVSKYNTAGSCHVFPLADDAAPALLAPPLFEAGALVETNWSLLPRLDGDWRRT